MYTIILVLVILVSLVVIHELGHFIAAKLFGIRVDEFGVGYPPRALTFGRWGGTEYTLNWLPFGGFVRLWGEGDESGNDPRGFVHAVWYKQVIVLIAGIAMNMLVAWMLFAVALHLGIPREVEDTASATDLAHAQLIVTDVYPASPAAVAGVKVGDTIISVADNGGTTLTHPATGAFVSFVRSHLGKPLALTFVHAKATTTATVIPVNAVIPNAPAQPALGVGLRLTTTTPLPWQDACVLALDNTKNAFVTIGYELFDLLQQLVHRTADLSGLVGPVGLVGVVHDASQNGWGTIFALAGFISINLAIVNSLPIPALDGGRIVVVIIELIIRRRLPALVVHIVSLAGVILIVGLMLVVTYHDVARLFT